VKKKKRGRAFSIRGEQEGKKSQSAIHLNRPTKKRRRGIREGGRWGRLLEYQSTSGKGNDRGEKAK